MAALLLMAGSASSHAQNQSLFLGSTSGSLYEVDPSGNVTLFAANIFSGSVHAVAVGSGGNVFSLDGNGNVYESLADGSSTSLFASGLANPQSETSLAFDASGDLFVGGNQQITKIDPAGNVSVFFADQNFGSISGIAVNGSGSVFTLNGNGVIYQTAADGSSDSVFVSSGLSAGQPFGLTLGANGNLYAGGNNQIFQVDASGTVTTFFQDTSGSLGGVTALAADGNNNIFTVHANFPSTVYETDGNSLTNFASGNFISSGGAGIEPAATPEPAALALAGLGALGLFAWRRPQIIK